MVIAARELVRRLLADTWSVEAVVEAGSDPARIGSMLRVAGVAGATIEWVEENGLRIDAGLVRGGDEWRLVVVRGATGRALSVDLFTRPPVAAPVPGGRAVVVNGPSSSGKSTLLQALQRADPTTPWVLFDEPEHVGTVATEFLIWAERAPNLHRGYLEAIAAITRAGNSVAIAAGQRPQPHFATVLADVPVLWVGLECAPDRLVARHTPRADRWGGLLDGGAAVHEGWRYDLTFDTSNDPDPATLARGVLDAVGELHK